MQAVYLHQIVLNVKTETILMYLSTQLTCVTEQKSYTS